MTRVLRLGTRKSALARAQAQTVADGITERTGQPVELVGVTTYGDVARAPLAQLSQIGGTGVFVSALRERLLAGEIDLAVHSLKDLPTAGEPGLVVAAVPPREDPRDVLVAGGGRKLADLPPGARVGTGSPRRAAQLLMLRPDLEVVPIRGNADTRLGKVTSGEFDAVVLAHAGLARLARLDAVTEVFEPEQMLPAPGQGALAAECRADDTSTVSALGVLDDAGTRAAVTAERALLAALEAGCSAPVGAHADLAGPGKLDLCAAVLALDGSASVRLSAAGSPDEAEGLGRRLAADLLAKGAAALMGGHVH
ncbi:MAG: hydroxymethylbilane synthase [Streptosporangiales bacterium]|nr:hydroxymethylbilane synthase [Streptosporangiales bacterium]